MGEGEEIWEKHKRNEKELGLLEQINLLSESNEELERQLEIMTYSYNNLRILIDENTKPLERTIIHQRSSIH
jgi:hypothetical protein